VDVELPTTSVPPTPTTESARINRGDKLAPLLAFSQPFLATERYLEGGPTVRGHAGRQEVQRGIVQYPTAAVVSSATSSSRVRVV
jgi:hypothetical protein